MNNTGTKKGNIMK